MATAKHESDNFRTFYEYHNGDDPVTYFNDQYGHRIDLGNRPDTNDGYDYRERGYAQITGRANYERLGDAIGEDLLNNPDLAADPDIAARIIAYGMVHGSYTGKSLDDYISPEGVDYINRRHPIYKRWLQGMCRIYNRVVAEDGWQTARNFMEYQLELQEREK